MGNAQCLAPGNQDDFAADCVVRAGYFGPRIAGGRCYRMAQPALDAVTLHGVACFCGYREAGFQVACIAAVADIALQGAAFKYGPRRAPVRDEAGAFADE